MYVGCNTNNFWQNQAVQMKIEIFLPFYTNTVSSYSAQEVYTVEFTLKGH